MELAQYLAMIEQKQIPTAPPSCSTLDGHIRLQNGPHDFMDSFEARDFCIHRGMWPIVDQIWTGKLAQWIGDRTVLEIMAGGGWVAKALSDHGIDIIATDDYSWNEDRHKKINYVYEVKKLHAIVAIASIEADILLVSWPPYGDETIVTASHLWGNDRPIIYIGESEGGCNAPEKWFKYFNIIENMPNIPLFSWDGIHDYVEIGYWQLQTGGNK